jgi:hypothetical protein
MCAGSFLRMTRIRPGRADQVPERRVRRIFLALRIYQQLCGARGPCERRGLRPTSDQPGVKES